MKTESTQNEDERVKVSRTKPEHQWRITRRTAAEIEQSRSDTMLQVLLYHIALLYQHTSQMQAFIHTPNTQ